MEMMLRTLFMLASRNVIGKKRILIRNLLLILAKHMLSMSESKLLSDLILELMLIGRVIDLQLV